MENSSIDNVKQSNLLSLFSTIKQESNFTYSIIILADKTEKKKKDVIIIDKYSKILEEIGDLWEEDQYQKDFSSTDS